MTRRSLALPLALVMLVVDAGLAAGNEFAAASRVGTATTYAGLRGVQGIRTDPATVNGIAYVHITQIDVGPTQGDFVAIGTVNGRGTNPGNCADHYDPMWSGYYDGVVSGIYFCENFSHNTWGSGSSPSFNLDYKACPSGGALRFVLTFAGVVRVCKDMGTSSGSRVIVGIETSGASTVDRDIDAKYTQLMRRGAAGTLWANYGFSGTNQTENPNYTVDLINDTTIYTYLAPLA